MGSKRATCPRFNLAALTTVSGLRRGHTTAPETKPIGPVEDVIVDATVLHLSETVAAMVRLQRLTGMRPDEVCRLRPCDVDRSGDIWRFAPAEHKTAHHGRERIIHIGPKGQDILRRICCASQRHFVLCRRKRLRKSARSGTQRKTPLNCGNRPGSNRLRRKSKLGANGRYTANTYRRAIHRACDVANEKAHDEHPEVSADERIVPRWSPNRLRHTAATEIRKRFGLEAAQVTLGHAAADITQVYAERDLTKAAAVMREVG